MSEKKHHKYGSILNARIFIIFLIVLFCGLGIIFNFELPFGKTEKNYISSNGQNLYYWTLKTGRIGFLGHLPDRFRVYTLSKDLVFDSVSTKPFFGGKDFNLSRSKISTSLDKSKDEIKFKETYFYSFAEASFIFILYPNNKFVDLRSEVKYTQNKNVQFEGFEFELNRKNKISYYDETFTKKNFSRKEVLISAWSAHIIESKGLTLTDNSAEVMNLKQSFFKRLAKFYSYRGPTRENIYRRDYKNAKKAEPKIDINFKRHAGDKVELSVRAIVTDDKLPAVSFRWPYAKDSVISFTAHADLGNFLNVMTDPFKRLKAVYWGTSDEKGVDYGKKGVFAHNLRLTQTIFPVNNDNEKAGSYFGNLEDIDFKNTVTEIYRRGIDIGAHRLTDDGIGLAKDVASKIDLGFNLVNVFNPTVWIDHSNSGDCVNTPERELISGCGSINGNKLNMTDRLAQGTWKYLWAGGQDSQNSLYKDYALNAFSSFRTANQILYSYQGATNALIPDKFKFFASSFVHENEMFNQTEVEQLAQEKGFNNTHIYFTNYGPKVLKASLPTGEKDINSIWEINPKLEIEFALLDKGQSEDKVWVRDFTTVADYLQAWKNIKILDFTQNSITIQNQGKSEIKGLTLYKPAGAISVAHNSDIYYPYTRNQYVVLSKMNPDETRTIDFAFDKIDQIPQILNFTDKQIEISQVEYLLKDKKLKIEIAPSTKPGQDLVVGETEITIKFPQGLTPVVLRDGSNYSDYTFDAQTVKIKTDTNQHNFEINL